jgi:hypothetical protein
MMHYIKSISMFKRAPPLYSVLSQLNPIRFNIVCPIYPEAKQVVSSIQFLTKTYGFLMYPKRAMYPAYLNNCEVADRCLL